MAILTLGIPLLAEQFLNLENNTPKIILTPFLKMFAKYHLKGNLAR